MSEVRWRPLAAATLAVLVLTAGIGALAVSAPTGEPDAGAVNGTDAPRMDAASDDPYARARAAGYTGENVSVGVVDVTGFDRSHPLLGERVVASRSFGAGERNGAHGTAAAAAVATVAPDADLALATFDTPADYRAAIGWLVEQDVDVIVAPVSFYGAPGDGTAGVSQAVTRAVRSGVVVVAPAGNLATGHWRGQYRDVEDGTLRFAGGYRNYLDGSDRRVSLWLSWDRAHGDESYTVELYRETENGSRLVAVSQRYAADDAPNARIVARVEDGRHFAVVRGPANATNATLELTSPTHSLRFARPQGSVAAPATAPGALVVGAYNRSAGLVESYSSRGPTADGRRGVDLVARAEWPTRDGPVVGSSASAAYTGGVAALVLDSDPERSPAGIERALESTATDLTAPGPDPVSGHGRVRPWRAVRTVANDTSAT